MLGEDKRGSSGPAALDVPLQDAVRARTSTPVVQVFEPSVTSSYRTLAAAPGSTGSIGALRGRRPSPLAAVHVDDSQSSRDAVLTDTTTVAPSGRLLRLSRRPVHRYVRSLVTPPRSIVGAYHPLPVLLEPPGGEFVADPSIGKREAIAPVLSIPTDPVPSIPFEVVGRRPNPEGPESGLERAERRDEEGLDLAFDIVDAGLPASERSNPPPCRRHTTSPTRNHGTVVR